MLSKDENQSMIDTKKSSSFKKPTIILNDCDSKKSSQKTKIFDGDSSDEDQYQVLQDMK